MEDIHLDECVRCGAGLLAVSDICPQCGCPKNKSIKPDEPEEKLDSVEIENYEEFVGQVADDIKNPSRKKSAEIKNKIFRPAGIRLISISYMLFGIFLMVFGIVFASAVMFLVMTAAMGTLGDIGDMEGIIMLPGMGGMDASTRSSIDSIIDLNRITGSPSASEIDTRMNSAGMMNVDVMMEIIGEIGIVAIIEIIVGLLVFGIGLFLFKGKKWARPAIITSSIISVPLVASFVTFDTLVLLGMVAFNGMILYYMLKSKAREYFNQTSTKKSKIKTSPTIKVKSTKVKQTVESVHTPDISSPSGTAVLDSASSKVRPTGVTILVVLQALSGIIIIGFAAYASVILGSMGIVEGASTMFSTGGILMWVITGIATALGVGSFVMAWGLLRGKSWAWTWTLIFTIIRLIFDLPSMNVVGVIVDLVILYYLFRPHVKDFFGKREQQL